MKVAVFIMIVIPFAGVVAAAISVWGWGFGWLDLALLVGLYLISGLGTTVGYHRLFSHRSFETNIVVKFIFAVFGAMAIQSSLFDWVARHRVHHQHSDQPEDPHSPYHQGHGIRGWLRGFWHAHIGWTLRCDKFPLDHYIKDLHQSAALRVASALGPFWAALGLLIPVSLGGMVAGFWVGAIRGLLWGGLVRLFLVHHVTWSVNSACHLWGRRTYRSGDHSRDNLIFGVLALGEGWHNTHHAFPTSARHGLRWWQFDLSYWVIRALALVGLAWNVKLPSTHAQAQARVVPTEAPATAPAVAQ
jgi:stearoyl-CoA desaturase (delta-9 desaturase)